MARYDAEAAIGGIDVFSEADWILAAVQIHPRRRLRTNRLV